MTEKSEREIITHPIFILFMYIGTIIPSLVLGLNDGFHVLHIVFSIIILSGCGLFSLVITSILLSHYSKLMWYIIKVKTQLIEKTYPKEIKDLVDVALNIVMNINRIGITLPLPDIRLTENDVIELKWNPPQFTLIIRNTLEKTEVHGEHSHRNFSFVRTYYNKEEVNTWISKWL